MGSTFLDFFSQNNFSSMMEILRPVYTGDFYCGNSMQFLSRLSCNSKIARVNQVRFSVRFVAPISQGFWTCLKLAATLARQKLHRVSATKIACVNGPLMSYQTLSMTHNNIKKPYCKLMAYEKRIFGSKWNLDKKPSWCFSYCRNLLLGLPSVSQSKQSRAGKNPCWIDWDN